MLTELLHVLTLFETKVHNSFSKLQFQNEGFNSLSGQDCVMQTGRIILDGHSNITANFPNNLKET